jgi:hypothetical protein
MVNQQFKNIFLPLREHNRIMSGKKTKAIRYSKQKSYQDKTHAEQWIIHPSVTTYPLKKKH